jgi:hypothetical protein
MDMDAPRHMLCRGLFEKVASANNTSYANGELGDDSMYSKHKLGITSNLFGS